MISMIMLSSSSSTTTTTTINTNTNSTINKNVIINDNIIIAAGGGLPQPGLPGLDEQGSPTLLYIIFTFSAFWLGSSVVSENKQL